MKPTIDTLHPGWDCKDSPTRGKAERSREQFAKDNKPSEEARKNGLSFVKPMHPNAYRPYEGE